MPDFLQTDAGPGALSSFIEADQLLDLTDVVEQNQGAIYPDALNSVRFRDRYWEAPWAMTVANLMYYNAELLADNDINPSTLRLGVPSRTPVKRSRVLGLRPSSSAKKRMA